MAQLYAILDLPHRLLLDPRAVLDAMLDGGAAVIQLRSKQAPFDPELVSALGHRCEATGVPLILNDDLELTLAGIPGVAGVHLGQGDLVRLGEPEQAKQLRSELRERGLCLGISTHDLAQLESALLTHEPDYVGFGPVFATNSKRDHDPVVGLDGLARACEVARVPVVAIGGIDLARAEAVAAQGVAAVAVIGALIPMSWSHEHEPVEIIRARSFALARALAGGRNFSPKICGARKHGPNQ